MRLLNLILLTSIAFASPIAFAEDNISQELQARSANVARATKAQEIAEQLNYHALSENNIKAVMGDKMEFSYGSPFVSASNKYKTDKNWICSVGALVSVALEKKSYSITCYDKDMKITLEREVKL